GSTVCTRGRPACERCPVKETCYAFKEGKQSELPSPKARREKPERSCVMLVWRQQDNVLLQARPSSGIWGGLRSLPEFDSTEAMRLRCAEMGADASRAQRMGGMAHAFTHFKLNIEPWYLNDHGGAGNVPAPTDHSWVPERELPHAALPSPIRK